MFATAVLADLHNQLKAFYSDIGRPSRYGHPYPGRHFFFRWHFACVIGYAAKSEPEVPPGCEDLEKVLIGEDVSERLDVTAAKFRVIVTRRPKYAYRGRDGVIQAPAPPHIIESGIPTEALLAQIAVAKYADGLPLYRQEAIYARDKTELSRSLMAQWMGKVGFELQPLADYVLERIKQGERVFADETTLPTLAPGSGKTQKAWLWAYARDDRPFGRTSPPMVAYRNSLQLPC